jgi:CRISPR-associated exonuclease Cas4
MQPDDETIPLSALQHWVYCPRQCALIHLERLWAESRDTAEGRILHDRAHEPGSELRKGVRVVTAMPLVHEALNIAGVADVVEFHRTPNGPRAVPVEYKRGRPKLHRADEVQLCAQALCLESMFGYEIPSGFLYYGKTHLRKEVKFDADLRALTVRTVDNVRAMLRSAITPAAEYIPQRCDSCSLIELCRPKWIGSENKVARWLSKQISSDTTETE